MVHKSMMRSLVECALLPLAARMPVQLSVGLSQPHGSLLLLVLAVEALALAEARLRLVGRTTAVCADELLDDDVALSSTGVSPLSSSLSASSSVEDAALRRRAG